MSEEMSAYDLIVCQSLPTDAPPESKHYTKSSKNISFLLILLTPTIIGQNSKRKKIEKNKKL